VLSPSEKPTLFVPNQYFHLAKEIMWFDDVRFVPPEKLGQEVASILKPRLSAKDTIGYVGRTETPFPVYEAFLQGLPGVTWVQANRIIDEFRIVKDSAALTLHRRAAEISDAMFQTFTREVRRGKKGFQLQADVEHTARCEGCEHASTFLAIGPVADRARYTKRENGRVPQAGDQILLALFLSYEGHWGHAIRMGTMGDPNPSQRRAFDIALEMEEAALERVKPGRDLSELWKASARVFKKYFPDIDARGWFWLRSGHGIGLDYSDPILTDIFRFPYDLAVKDAGKTGEPPIPIQPGMLLELHPNVFIPNEAAGAIGDMVLVTEDGYEILNQFPRELIRW
jgi:Xaa-Pro aminopeptidase